MSTTGGLANEQVGGREHGESGKQRKEAEKARAARDAALRQERGDRSRAGAQAPQGRRESRLDRPTLPGRRDDTSGEGKRAENQRDSGDRTEGRGAGRSTDAPQRSGDGRSTTAPARDRGGSLRADRPGPPAPDQREQMESALRGLMEAVGVKPNEAALRRQLDAWYGSRPDASDRLTPQQNRALEQAHARAMDRSMADVERQARRNVANMDTRQLIETADALDAELSADDTGPLVRGEIARTLLAMHGELDRRIRAAPLDDRGLPKLEGVRWEEGDPLAGIAEAIGPFGKIDLWTLASLESPPPDERAVEDKARERVPPDAAERAERERVAAPSDGVGFAFGADWPDPSEWARFWQAKGSDLQIGLLDPDTVVVVEGMASAPGTDAANLALGQRRANNIKGLLMAAGIPEDRILVISYGEGPARSANGRDRAEHRIARIGTAGGSIGRDAPTPEQEVPLKTSIPEQYTPPERYPTSEREARRLARSPDEYYERIKKPWTLPRSPQGLAREILRGVPRALSDTGNFTAWCEKMRGDTSQDHKLWETPPPSPLRTLKGQTPFRGIVEYQLKRGGYDPKTMYTKYLVHWFRRGVR